MRLRSDDLVLREIDGETVLLDLVSSTYFATNATGTFLVNLLADDRERDALVSALADEFELDDATAQHDTDAFLARLREQNLLA
ncbi:MAG: PqqD family protein [Nocardioides sp.]|uniref:PqqD family protein n=1 Tax=Nocardioides sp. TaxID=35761 RepID=UPI003F00B671